MDTSYYYRDRRKVRLTELLRDILISILPERLKWLTTKFLPYEPDFIFFTHPRNKEDIYATIPVAKFLRKIVPYYVVRAVLNLSPCYIVACVNGPRNKKGYIISVTELPDRLFVSRQLTLKLIERSVSFFRKISDKKVYVGLAAWWPIVSNSGLVFKKYLKPDDNISITSGHTATLASIYLSTIKLSEIVQIPLSELRLLVVGVGKIGGSFCDLFNQKVKKIGLVDKNPFRIETVKKAMETISPHALVELIPVEDSDSENVISQKVQEYDIVLCTTSNIGLLIKDDKKLKNCIVVDDSRPEAFPRIFSIDRRVAILEGGLMKIPAVEVDSDFGFGRSENVFGCLSEAIILSLDQEQHVQPNVGEIDYENLHRLIEFCRRNKIDAGDFMCGKRIVGAEELMRIATVDKRNSGSVV